MKVLCFGDSEADFERTIAKAELIAKKQVFDCLLCLGNLFSRDTSSDLLDAVLQEKRTICLPLYFSEGSLGLPQRLLDHAVSNAGRVCDNLYLLDCSGQLKLSSGLKIGFQQKLSAGCSAFTSLVDVLLLAQEPDVSAAPLLIETVPKYVFFPKGQFSEAAPYKLQMADGDLRVVREIGLASVANVQKAKWFYAFNLSDDVPDKHTLAKVRPFPHVAQVDETIQESKKPDVVPRGQDVSTNTIESEGKKPPSGYVCKLCQLPDDHYFRDCPSKTYTRKRKRIKEESVSTPIDPSTCFFCLSNPNLARHLIVSIGDAGSYLVLPKGGMTQHHVIILPIDHKPTLTALASTRTSVEDEMKHYISALEQFYASIGMTGVLFDISRTKGVHYHMQMMPVPNDKIDDLKDAFFAFSETEKITLESRTPAPQEEDYFRVYFPGTELSLCGTLHPNKRFDLQFGRRVISDVMGVPERAHWKDCIRTDEQETEDARLFKTAFKKFDFTI